MAGKSPDRQTWKCDWRVSGQFKQLEKEQKKLLKQFSRYQAEQEGYLAQNKTMTGIQAYKYVRLEYSVGIWIELIRLCGDSSSRYRRSFK